MEFMVFYINRAKFTLMEIINTMDIAVKPINGFVIKWEFVNFHHWNYKFQSCVSVSCVQ